MRQLLVCHHVSSFNLCLTGFCLRNLDPRTPRLLPQPANRMFLGWATLVVDARSAYSCAASLEQMQGVQYCDFGTTLLHFTRISRTAGQQPSRNEIHCTLNARVECRALISERILVGLRWYSEKAVVRLGFPSCPKYVLHVFWQALAAVGGAAPCACRTTRFTLLQLSSQTFQ